MDDGWQRSREPARDVRSIFAEGAAPPVEESDRHRPLPSVIRMPGRLLELLPRPLRVPVVVMIFAAAVGLVPIGIAVRAASRRADAAQQRAEIAQRRAALTNDQAARISPMAATEDPVVQLERLVGAEVRRRQRAGELSGSQANARCHSVGPDRFRCFARISLTDTSAGRLQRGYGYRAALMNGGTSAAVCKENPRPLHPDTQSYVRVGLDPRCLGDP